MDTFQKNTRKGGMLIIILITMLALLTLSAYGQRYRATGVSYSQVVGKFNVIPKLEKGKLVQLEVRSLENESLFAYVIDMIVLFKDGSTLALRNSPPIEGQYVFMTYFDVSKMQRKQLKNKEILHWELKCRGGRTIKDMPQDPKYLKRIGE